MASMPLLDAASLDLRGFRAAARGELLAAITSVTAAVQDDGTGSHALVLDPDLSGPLGLVAEVKDFKCIGIDKIHHLDPSHLVTDCTSIIYVVRPEVHLAKQIANQVSAMEEEGDTLMRQRQYSILFVPRRSLLCDKVLDDQGVAGRITIREHALQVFVLEADLLSLELPDCFCECFHDRNHSSLHTCAAALAKLQAQFGYIENVHSKGECSEIVVHMMRQMSDNTRIVAGRHGAGSISELLLLDRDVDLVTPLCTELTYEGLINQLFGIKHG